MISGIAALLLALCAAEPSPVPPDAAALVARLARPIPASTQYAEVRFVHLLREPLVLRGELDYGGAGRLGKHVDTPFRETTTISDGVARVEREGRPPREFPLDRAPELQGLLAGFGALLGGDAAALNQRFAIALRASGSRWTLELQPRDAALARHLRTLVVDGAGSEPACFCLYEADGDASFMLLGESARGHLAPAPTRAGLEATCGRIVP